MARIRLQTAGGPQVMVYTNSIALPRFLAEHRLSLSKIWTPGPSLQLFCPRPGTFWPNATKWISCGSALQNAEAHQNARARLVAGREAEDRLEGRPKQSHVDEQIAQVRCDHEEKIEQIRKASSDLWPPIS